MVAGSESKKVCAYIQLLNLAIRFQGLQMSRRPSGKWQRIESVLSGKSFSGLSLEGGCDYDREMRARYALLGTDYRDADAGVPLLTSKLESGGGR